MVSYRMTLRRLVLIIAMISFSAACGSPEAQTPAERGREVYMVSCIACHSPNPELPGSLGPELKGSSRELIEARVMRAEYPPGYKPKRSTRQMVRMPALENSLDDLAAYLK